jgi:hypothetical protein
MSDIYKYTSPDPYTLVAGNISNSIVYDSFPLKLKIFDLGSILSGWLEPNSSIKSFLRGFV